MQRAIACASLADGTSSIHFSGSPCADSLAALRVAEALGAMISREPGILNIEGSRLFSGAQAVNRGITLQCGESGLCMRMFSPIASLLDAEVEMKAQGSLQRRPMGMMEEPFAKLGVECKTEEGHPPVKLRGPLKGGFLSMDSGGSSQFITGLLMALPLTEKGGRIELANPVSMGYLNLTVQICRRFGVEILIADDYRKFEMRGGQEYLNASLEIEGDWSGAAFLAVGAAISSESGLRIRTLDPRSSQPDRAILGALGLAGAKTHFSGNELVVSKGELEAFVFDSTQCPDLFPPLAVLASACKGVSRIKGIGRLRGKESDRALSIQRCLDSLGVNTELLGDEMLIWGGKISGGTVDSCEDHRIAMAAATAALVASGVVLIEGAECVEKSWPRFFEDLEAVRA
jgi:3-phosphoshikimate 1-carboxyvinyltransferase